MKVLCNVKGVGECVIEEDSQRFVVFETDQVPNLLVSSSGLRGDCSDEWRSRDPKRLG